MHLTIHPSPFQRVTQGARFLTPTRLVSPIATLTCLLLSILAAPQLAHAAPPGRSTVGTYFRYYARQTPAISEPTVAVADPICFATADDGTTAWASADSQAVRDAISDAVLKNASTVKLAGYCLGTDYDSASDNWQIAVITTSLTLIGGYTATDWSASYPLTQPTVLDADYAGRVIYSTSDLDVQNFTVLHGTTDSGFLQAPNAARALVTDYVNGGGIYASAPVTLTGMSILENEAYCACNNGLGGGIFAPSIVAISSLVQHNFAFAGGGLAAFDPNVLGSQNTLRPSDVMTGQLVISNSQIVENLAYGGGGALALVADITASQFISNLGALLGGGLFAFESDIQATRFENNLITTQAFSSMPFRPGRFAALKAMRAAESSRLVPFINLPQTAQYPYGGAGAFVGQGAITDSTFISNTSYGIAGGLYIGMGSVINTDFIANQTFDPIGGLYGPNEADTLTGGAGLACVAQLIGAQPTVDGVPDLVIVGGNYISNTSTGSGGGLYAECDLSIEDTQFVSNTAYSAGGGLYVTGAELTWITHTTFSNNVVWPYDDAQLPQQPSVVTPGEGGGAFIRIITDSVTGVTINRSFFVDNSANTGGALALYTDGSANIINSIFARNQASDGPGSALQLGSGTVNLLHSSIADVSVNAASAIALLSGTLGITDTIITSHTVGISTSNETTLIGSHNLFFGNATDRIGAAALVNTVSSDPGFANPNSTSSAGFRTSPDGAAVDAGLDIDIKNDYADDPRPVGLGPDIGAFETSAAAELGIGGFAVPNLSRPGEPLTISVVAVNTGQNTAYDVVITMSVGAGLISPVCQSVPACVTDGQLMTVTLTQLEANNTHTIVIVGAADPTIQDNTTLIVTTGVQTLRDVNKGNNYAAIRANVAVTADIEVGKWALSPTVLAGQPITFMMVITNNGPGIAQSVVMTDDFSSMLQSVQCQGPVICTISMGKAIADLGSLAVGRVETFTVSGIASANASNGAVLVNNVSISGLNDSSAGNNVASASISISTLAGLSITIDDAPDPVASGGAVVYLVRMSNAGPNIARNVQLSGQQSAGSIISVAPSQGNCTILPCALGNLPVNSSAVVMITVTAPSTLGVFTHVATVSSDTPLLSLVNPTATAQTTVVQINSADVNVSKRVSSNTVFAGERVTYTLVVTNLGPSLAQSVKVTDVLNSALQNLSCSATGAGICSITGNTVGVSFVSLAVNQPQSIVIVATIKPDLANGTLIPNTVVLSSITPDPNPGNGGQDAQVLAPGASVTVNTAADLSASVRNMSGLSINQPGKYEIVVQNKGPSVARDVVLTNTLPAGLIFVPSALAMPDATMWACVANGQVVVCRAALLDVKSSNPVILNVRVTEGAPQQVTNSVQVGSGVFDPNVNNNQATDISVVERPTAITLVSFTVLDKRVAWATSAELDTFGFHVWRSKTGERADAERITTELIPARGRDGGASYSFVDSTAAPGMGYAYWLQEIEISGNMLEYGPATTILGEQADALYAVLLPMLGR